MFKKNTHFFVKITKTVKIFSLNIVIQRDRKDGFSFEVETIFYIHSQLKFRKEAEDIKNENCNNLRKTHY